MNNEQEITRVINQHAKDLSSLHCVIYGLLKQLRATQGEQGLEAAFIHAMNAASMHRPPSVVTPSSEMIKSMFDMAK